MRIASYNVENLFSRVKVMNREDRETARDVLGEYSRLNAVIGKDRYTTQDKARMVELLTQLGLEKTDETQFVILRQNRGKLVKRPRGGGFEIVANGRADWIGWLELKSEAVNE